MSIHYWYHLGVYLFMFRVCVFVYKKKKEKKNERKRKISTCVYVHNILHHWVCILMFEGHLIEYVCRWEFVCEPSEALHFLYSFFRVFWEWDEWLYLRSSVTLSFPSLHSLMMWLHFMLDLSKSSFIFVFFASPSFSFFAFDSSISFHPLSSSYNDPFPGLLPSLYHHYTSHY